MSSLLRCDIIRKSHPLGAMSLQCLHSSGVISVKVITLSCVITKISSLLSYYISRESFCSSVISKQTSLFGRDINMISSLLGCYIYQLGVFTILSYISRSSHNSGTISVESTLFICNKSRAFKVSMSNIYDRSLLHRSNINNLHLQV